MLSWDVFFYMVPCSLKGGPSIRGYRQAASRSYTVT